MEMGYRESPSEAVEWLEAKQRSIANAAAERHRLGQGAQVGVHQRQVRRLDGDVGAAGQREFRLGANSGAVQIGSARAKPIGQATSLKAAQQLAADYLKPAPVIFTEADYSQSQLIEASNYLNAHYAGMAIEQVRSRVQQELVSLQGEIATLMQAAVQVSSEAMADDHNEVVISGERNLLSVSDFSSDMGHLRRAFELFEQKTQLMRLLDVSSQAEGVRIYIGGESQIVPMQELSVVSSPYEVDGQIVGTLGVIGPTRMPYDRMIQIVNITSRLVSNALSQSK